MFKDKSTLVALGFFIALAIVLGATRRDFSRRNVRLFSGMAESPAFEPQSANPIFASGATARPLPDGTIARNQVLFPYPNTVDGRQQAGREFHNPIARTDEALDRGKFVYQTFCLHCHGSAGAGDGPVAKRSVLGMSLIAPMAVKRGDGELYHIVTYGRLAMPPHGGLVASEDRWKVIHYVRGLQEAKAKADAERQEAEASPELVRPILRRIN